MWGMGSGMWFWLLIIAGIAYYFYGGFKPRRVRRASTPLNVARMRYANGEISLEEFEEIKRNISS
jgi:uncharacterized membrane protein